MPPEPCGKRRVKRGKRKRIVPGKNGAGGEERSLASPSPGRAGRGHRISSSVGSGVAPAADARKKRASGDPGGDDALALRASAGAGAGAAGNAGSVTQLLPPTHASDRAEMLKHLATYRKAEARIKASGRAKPDMIAYSEVRDDHEPACAPRWGHVAGTEVGESLTGRGEVAITGRG